MPRRTTAWGMFCSKKAGSTTPLRILSRRYGSDLISPRRTAIWGSPWGRWAGGRKRSSIWGRRCGLSLISSRPIIIWGPCWGRRAGLTRQSGISNKRCGSSPISPRHTVTWGSPWRRRAGRRKRSNSWSRRSGSGRITPRRETRSRGCKLAGKRPALRTRRDCDKRIGGTMKNAWILLAVVCALVLGVYAYMSQSGVLELLSPNAADAYYNLLVQGFQAGQLNLKKEVPPGLTKLADPYDPAANVVYWRS